MSFAKCSPYLRLMRFDKPIGIFLLLWPTLWALWLVNPHHPSLSIVCIFTAGVIIMRAAGCVINDIMDRNFDKYVARTCHRPLATGEISIYSAWVLFFFLMMCAFLLVLALNPFTVLLAVAGAMLAITYPLLKRVTHLPQLGLGIAFAWSVPMVFSAMLDKIPAKAWLVFFAAALWPVIYDTMYAMVDREDDLKIQVKSTAILFGQYDKRILFFLQILFLLVLIAIGYFFQLRYFYYMCLIVVVALQAHQQFLIHTRDRGACFKAFKDSHWVGFWIFAGILLDKGL